MTLYRIEAFGGKAPASGYRMEAKTAQQALSLRRKIDKLFDGTATITATADGEPVSLDALSALASGE